MALSLSSSDLGGFIISDERGRRVKITCVSEGIKVENLTRDPILYVPISGRTEASVVLSDAQPKPMPFYEKFEVLPCLR